MKRKYLWLIGGVSVLLVVVAAYLLFPVTGAEIANDKVYVAAEDAGRIDVISPKSQSVIAKIELANKENADGAMYMAHNVQVAPDGKSVWVTANAMANHTASLKTRTHRLYSVTTLEQIYCQALEPRAPSAGRFQYQSV